MISSVFHSGTEMLLLRSLLFFRIGIGGEHRRFKRGAASIGEPLNVGKIRAWVPGAVAADKGFYVVSLVDARRMFWTRGEFKSRTLRGRADFGQYSRI